MVIPERLEATPGDDVLKGEPVTIFPINANLAKVTNSVETSFFHADFGHVLGFSNLFMGLHFRKFLRVPFQEKIYMCIAHDGAAQQQKKIKVHALNLSGSGIALHSPTLGLVLGTALRLEITNPEFPGYNVSRGAAVLNGRIARVFQAADQPDSEELGIEFVLDGTSEGFRQADQISKFCRQIAFTGDSEPERRETPCLANCELLDLTADLSTSLDIDTILFKINTSASKLVSSEVSSILLFDDTKQHLYFKISSGGKAPILNRINVSQDTGGIAWWVAHTGEPAIVNNVEADSRFTGRVDNATGFKTKSLLAVPIVLAGEILGVLEAVNKRGKATFTELNLQIFTSLANQIAILIRNAQMTEKYENFFTNTIELIVKAIESVGNLIGLMSSGHCWRVGAMATAIGQQFGISGQEFDDLYYGAVLHDIGLLACQYQKSSQFDYYDLTTLEDISSHTMTGVNMVKEIRLLQGTVPIIRHHHEHFDGTGYPDGLKKDRIPLGARIVAATEAYEEMLYSHKPDKQAIAYLKDHAGRQFDPQVVEVLVKQIAQRG